MRVWATHVRGNLYLQNLSAIITWWVLLPCPPVKENRGGVVVDGGSQWTPFYLPIRYQLVPEGVPSRRVRENLRGFVVQILEASILGPSVDHLSATQYLVVNREPFGVKLWFWSKGVDLRYHRHFVWCFIDANMILEQRLQIKFFERLS